VGRDVEEGKGCEGWGPNMAAISIAYSVCCCPKFPCYRGYWNHENESLLEFRYKCYSRLYYSSKNEVTYRVFIIFKYTKRYFLAIEVFL